jgi:hypothetical protein
MKYVQSYQEFLTESTVSDIIKGAEIIAQNKGLSRSEDGSSFIKKDEEFVKKSIPITDVNNKLEYSWYKRRKLDEDLYMIDAIIDKIKSGVKLHPIVLDRDMKILDGNHRYIAYKKLKYKDIEAYIQK